MALLLDLEDNELAPKGTARQKALSDYAAARALVWNPDSTLPPPPPTPAAPVVPEQNFPNWQFGAPAPGLTAYEDNSVGFSEPEPPAAPAPTWLGEDSPAGSTYRNPDGSYWSAKYGTTLQDPRVSTPTDANTTGGYYSPGGAQYLGDSQLGSIYRNPDNSFWNARTGTKDYGGTLSDLTSEANAQQVVVPDQSQLGFTMPKPVAPPANYALNFNATPIEPRAPGIAPASSGDPFQDIINRNRGADPTWDSGQNASYGTPATRTGMHAELTGDPYLAIEAERLKKAEAGPSWWDPITSAPGKFAGGLSKAVTGAARGDWGDVGSGAMEALNAPVEASGRLGKTFAGEVGAVTAGTLDAFSDRPNATGLGFGDILHPGRAGQKYESNVVEKLLEDIRKAPIPDALGGSTTADYLATAARIGYDVATNPITYAGPGLTSMSTKLSANLGLTGKAAAKLLDIAANQGSAGSQFFAFEAGGLATKAAQDAGITDEALLTAIGLGAGITALGAKSKLLDNGAAKRAFDKVATEARANPESGAMNLGGASDAIGAAKNKVMWGKAGNEGPLGLTRGEEIANAIRDIPGLRRVTDFVEREASGRKVFGNILIRADEQASGLMRDRASAIAAGRSNAAATKQMTTVLLDKIGVKRDSMGNERITDLYGKPTLMEVADDLGSYETLLGPERTAAIKQINSFIEPYREAAKAVGLDVADARGVREGGVYLPRGKTSAEGVEQIDVVIGAGRKGSARPTSMNARVVESAKEGASQYTYTPMADNIQSYIEQFSKRISEKIVADAAKDIAVTKKSLIDSGIVNAYEASVKNLASITGRLATAEGRAGLANVLETELDKAVRQVEGATPTGVRDLAKLPTVVKSETGRVTRLSDSANRLATEEKYARPPGSEPVRIKMPVTEQAKAQGKVLQARADTVQNVVDKFNKLIPEDVDRIRSLDTVINRMNSRINALQERGGKWANEAQDLRDQLQQVTNKLDGTPDDIGIKEMYKRALESVNPQLHGYSPVPDNPFMAGNYYPTEFANAVEKVLVSEKPRSHGKLEVPVELFHAIQGIFRNINANADISFTGIQGLLPMTGDTKSFGTAWAVAMKAMKDPKAAGKFLLEMDAEAAATGSRWTIKELAKYVPIRGMENEINSPILNRVPVFKQSNVAFSTFADVGIPKMFKALAESAEASGFKLTEADLQALGNATTHAFGAARTRFLGPAGDFVMFAPRFFQSQINLVVRATMDWKTLEGTQARKLLGSLLFFGTALTVAENEAARAAGLPAIDRKELFDPDSPNFMRMRIKGHDYSIFGPWDSLLRAGIAMSPVSFHGDLKKPDPMYLIRSKAAPLVGLGIDLMTGETFTGDDPSSLRSLGKRILPFSAQGLVDQGLGGAGSLLGLKQSPQTAYEKKKEDMEGQYKDFDPAKLETPLTYAKPSDHNDDPLFVRQYSLDHPSEPRSKNGIAIDAILNREKEGTRGYKMAQLNATAQADEITLGDWRDKRKEFSQSIRDALEPLLKDSADKAPAKEGTPRYWLDSYYKTFEDSTKEGTSDLDYSLLDSKQATWLKENGPTALAYVREYAGVGKDDIEVDYLDAMNRLNDAGYFAGNENSIPRFRKKASSLSDQEILDLYSRASSAHSNEAEYKSLELATAIHKWMNNNGYSAMEIADVKNANKKSNANTDFVVFKETNEKLLNWFDRNARYSQTK